MPPEVWCVDQECGIARGADVFLLLTGRAPGLVARGLVSRAPFLAAALPDCARLWLDGGLEAVPLNTELVDRVELVWTQWHHQPHRGHRVAEWVRETTVQSAGPIAPRVRGHDLRRRVGVRHYRHHHLRLDVPRAG